MRKATIVLGALLALLAPGRAEWVSIGPEGGPIYCGTVAMTSPPTIYVGSTNSSYPLLKSTDYGANWTTAGANLSSYPYQLVTHPNDPNTLYGIVSSVFYRTTNGGENWTTTSLGSNTYGNDIAINPSNPQVIYIPGYKYDGSAWRPMTFKTTDGGTTWNPIQIDTSATSTVYSAAIDPVDTAVVYVGAYINSQTYVYKTTDCGATWTPYALPTNLYYVYSLLVSPVDHNIVFAGTLYGVCRSTDAGLTWTQQSTNNYNYRIAVAPDNPNIMYSAAYSYVYRSTDAGLTWSVCSGMSGTAIRTVLVLPGEAGAVYAGSTGGMYKSTDYGVAWSPASHGIIIGRIAVVSVNPHEPATVHAEFIDNDIFKTTDNGMTWTPTNTPLSCGNVCSILFDPTDPQRIWMLEASG